MWKKLLMPRKANQELRQHLSSFEESIDASIKQMKNFRQVFRSLRAGNVMAPSVSRIRSNGSRHVDD